MASANELKRRLRRAGLNNDAIEAAWPEWWKDDADAEPAARAQLRQGLARRLGLSPDALLGERVEFVWRHSARFKHLTAETEEQQAALASFGVTLGRLLIRATPEHWTPIPEDARELRSALLKARTFVDLEGLVSACWALGVPVVQLRVFPLDTKSMQAMIIQSDGRYAILLGYEANYPAQAAFTLAHELGHAALGHLSDTAALVDFELNHAGAVGDNQEGEADRFGLTLLTGSERPEISTSSEHYNAPTLADAVLRAGPTHRIDPGTLALCLAYQRSEWAIAMSALRHIYGVPRNLARQVNGIAVSQLSWDELDEDSAIYVKKLLGIGH